MNTETPDPEQMNQGDDDLHRFVQAVGLVVKNNAMKAWLSQSDAGQAVEDCYTILNELLDTVDHLQFKIMKDTLTVNNEVMYADNILIEQFVECLVEHDVTGFEILKDVTQEEFAKLIEILSAMPWQLEELGGFDEFIKSVGCTHILPLKITYKEVSESETVVSKDQKTGGGTPKGKEPDKNAVENIVAFLKEQDSTPDAELGKQVHDVASNPEKMAELILQAAQVRQGAADIAQGETLADIVVGCLRKTFDGIVQDPAVKTKTGNKNASKTLLLLEEEMLDKLRGEPGGEECTDAVSEAMGEMREKLRVDSLATDYLKKYRAAGNAEKSILKYVCGHGLGDDHTEYMAEQLATGGMPPQDWQKLVIKSGAPVKPESVADLAAGMGGVGQIASLLTRLEQIVDKAHGKANKEEGETLRETLAEVDNAIDGIVGQTQEHIDQFISDVEGQPGEGEETPGLLDQNNIEVLAEIVQEVCQPLSVIGCSLHMLRSHRVGTLDEEQTAMLNLAAESTERVQTLIENLRRISKQPDSLTPDENILKALYDIDTEA